MCFWCLRMKIPWIYNTRKRSSGGHEQNKNNSGMFPSYETYINLWNCMYQPHKIRLRVFLLKRNQMATEDPSIKNNSNWCRNEVCFYWKFMFIFILLFDDKIDGKCTWTALIGLTQIWWATPHVNNTWAASNEPKG